MSFGSIITFTLKFAPFSCFHKHPGVFFGAFLGPIFIVILFNVVVLFCVIVVVIQHKRKRVELQKDSLSPAAVARLIVSIIGIMTLLGMMWLFATLTFQTGDDQTLRDIFQTLFTLSASFQGFFIFIFYCILNKVARES